MHQKLAIVGAGGCGRSLLALLRQVGRGDELACFYEEPDCYRKRQVMDLPVRSLHEFEPDRQLLLLAIGSPRERLRLAAELPAQTRFASCVHPQAFFLEPLDIPAGTVIYPMTYFSRNIRLGAHSLIMTGTIMGHDLELGAGLTTSAHVGIGGSVRIGQAVFCGLHSAIRDGIQITDHVTLGMGAIAVRDLKEAGVYIGNPARKRKEV
ncbi:MAG: acetyltransferase [Candidatus Sericytochromatia bacterium]